jgi:hypothetical protein
VAAAAHGELEPPLAGELDGPRDVGRVGDAGDGGGPAVHRAREDATGGVIPAVAGGDDLAAETGGELGGDGHVPEAGSGRAASRFGCLASAGFGYLD